MILQFFASKLMLWAVILGFVVSTVGAGLMGYKYAANACKADKIAQLEKFNEIVADLDESNRDREADIERREKLRQEAIDYVIDQIPDYTPTDCALTPDGVRDVRGTVEGFFTDPK